MYMIYGCLGMFLLKMETLFTKTGTSLSLNAGIAIGKRHNFSSYQLAPWMAYMLLNEV
ncbi:hypothetical protein J2X61_003562 [Bacillus sp. 3255]|nr:hypothetical protein [Bacillus sp. 3255]